MESNTEAVSRVGEKQDGERKIREIRTEGLVKIYSKRRVADGVSIKVNQGEIVGLLGPNGAGKTTSFYMIVGMIRANRGKIYLDNIGHFKEAYVQAGPDGHRVSSPGALHFSQAFCSGQYSLCS